MANLKEDDPFDNPLVLSFLANFSLPNCFVPDRYLFQCEMDKISFSYTGKTSPDLDPKISKYLIGSFLLIKILVDKLLLHASEFFKGPGLKFSGKTFNNFKVMSACIYHAFKDIFSELKSNPNSTEVVTLNPKPIPRFKPILFGEFFG